MKLVMFDLDGTLLSYIHGISKGNREAFRKLHGLGYHLGVATGRRVSNVEELLGDDAKYFDVFIGENGYQTKDLKTSENTYTRKLTQQEMQEIIDEFKKTNHSIICKELLGLSAPEKSAKPEERTGEYYQKRPCVQIVEDAALAVEKILFNGSNNI